MVISDMKRCAWAGSDPEYQRYHDSEWGFPVTNDPQLFEKLALEGFQSGLSWLTILRKRENFRQAFANFDLRQVAAYNRRDVNRLLKDSGIVRHRGKVEAAINNARRALELVDEYGSLAAYFWKWDDAVALAQDLKRRGWKFVGPTTVLSFMQAMGLRNDHEKGCSIRGKVEKARKAQGRARARAGAREVRGRARARARARAR